MVGFSVVSNIVGGVVFWAMRNAARPLRVWRIVVAVVTVVSFVTPLGLDDPPVSMLLA